MRFREYVAMEVDTSRVCNYVHGGRGGSGRNVFFSEAIVTGWRALCEEEAFLNLADFKSHAVEKVISHWSLVLGHE